MTNEEVIQFWLATGELPKPECPITEQQAQRLALPENVYHALWAEVHKKQDPTAEWFADWLSRIPSYGCDCLADLRAWLAQNPPRYDDWLVWTWELHNAVNSKLGKPQFSLDDAYALHTRMIRIREPALTEKATSHKVSNKRLVITVAVDEVTQGELAISRDAFIGYAKKVGADYLEIIDPIDDCGHVCANKYAMIPYLDKYEQTLYLDADVIVRDTAPDIFEQVPIGSWGLVDDLEKVRLGSNGNNWMNGEILSICDSQNIPRYEVQKAYNSGVMVMPRNAHRSYFAPTHRIPDVWCCEQNFHSIMLAANKESIVELSDEWNLGYPWIDWLPKISTSHFVHVNGCKPQSLRLALMRLLRAGLPLDDALQGTQHAK